MNNPGDTIFTHEPLLDSKKYIRLLKLLRGGFGQHVVCLMSTWLAADAPTYDAISYTWGNPTSTTSITINGKTRKVRQNCEYALQQICATSAASKSSYIWLDALCINQDSTQEKNHQVAMMGQIYRQAAYVHACVGSHADDSETIFEAVVIHNHLLQRLKKQAFEEVDEFLSQPRIRRPIRASATLEIRSSLIVNAKSRGRLLRSLHAFIERPYFQRVWILQELYLAAQVFFHCGNDNAPGDFLNTLSCLIEDWVKQSFEDVPDCTTKRFQLFDKATRHFLLTNRRKACQGGYEIFFEPDGMWPTHLACFRLAARSNARFKLAEIMHYMASFESADPRDKLYGILNLVDGSDELGLLSPDYEKDAFSVATELIRMEPYFRESSLPHAVKFSRLLAVPVSRERFQRAWEGFRRHVPLTTAHVETFTTNPCQRCTSGAHDFFICDELFGTRIRPLKDHDDKGGAFIARFPAGECIELCGHNGETFAFSPPETQVGNWFLGLGWIGGIDEQSVGFILRETSDQRFRIVSVSNYRPNYVPRESYPARMICCWHPLELQILATVYANIDQKTIDCQIFNEILNDRSLISIDESYATFSRG